MARQSWLKAVTLYMNQHNYPNASTYISRRIKKRFHDQTDKRGTGNTHELSEPQNQGR